MSAGKEKAAMIGVGVAACVACCAGPVIGFLAALGLGTAAGIALSGVLGVAIAAIGMFVVLRRRRRRASACNAAPLAVETPTVRTGS